MKESLFSWWAHDLPSLDGRLRFAVYGLLLILSEPILREIPIQLANCPPTLYEPSGVFGLISNDPARLHGWMVSIVAGIRTPLVACWICSALGLFGRAPMIATAGLFFVFWGALKGASGSGHQWYLPLYTFTALALFSAPDRWSFDRLLERHFPGDPFLTARPGSLTETGLGPKLALAGAVTNLFGAGLTKLLEAGPAWMTGEALHNYLLCLPRIAPGWEWLYHAVIQRPWTTRVLSTWTLAVELGSVVLLLGPRFRLLWIVNACIFHIGIILLMIPDFRPQMVCYLLLIDWRCVGKALESGQRQFRSGRGPLFAGALAILLPKPIGCPELQQKVSPRHKGLALSLITLFLAGPVASVITHREWYPFTNVPMYCTQITETSIGPYSISDFDDSSALARIGREYGASGRPWFLTHYLPRRIRVVLTTPSADGTDLDVTAEIVRRYGDWFLWDQRATQAASWEFEHRFGKDFTAPNQTDDTPGQRLLRAVVPSLQPKFETYRRQGSRLRLLYLTSPTPCELAHIEF